VSIYTQCVQRSTKPSEKDRWLRIFVFWEALLTLLFLCSASCSAVSLGIVLGSSGSSSVEAELCSTPQQPENVGAAVGDHRSGTGAAPRTAVRPKHTILCLVGERITEDPSGEVSWNEDPSGEASPLGHTVSDSQSRNLGVAVGDLRNGTEAGPRTVVGPKHTILCLWSRTRCP